MNELEMYLYLVISNSIRLCSLRVIVHLENLNTRNLMSDQSGVITNVTARRYDTRGRDTRERMSSYYSMSNQVRNLLV